MSSGDTAEIRLTGAEPIENVPRSVSEHGHAVISLEVEASGGAHLLRIRKR
jgi:TusA-related sulfurtransferase